MCGLPEGSAPPLLRDPKANSCGVQGRHIMWGWLQERRKVGTYEYAGCLTVPRVLYLRGNALIQEPVRRPVECSTKPGNWLQELKHARVAEQGRLPGAGAGSQSCTGPHTSQQFYSYNGSHILSVQIVGALLPESRTAILRAHQPKNKNTLRRACTS